MSYKKNENLPFLNIKKFKSTLRNHKITIKLLDFSSISSKFYAFKSDIIDQILKVSNNKILRKLYLLPKSEFLCLQKTDKLNESLSFTSFFENTLKIDPRKIIIGDLRNTIFISAIIALSESPLYICQLMDYIEIKNEAIYLIYINTNGIWKELILDSILPFKRSSETKFHRDLDLFKKRVFLFSFYDDSPFNWIGILEKAYALAYNGFENLYHCVLEEILYDLTGAHIETYNISNLDNRKISDILLKYFNKGYPILLLKENYSNRIEKIYNFASNRNEWGYPVIDVRNTKSEFVLTKIRLMNENSKNFTFNKNSTEWPPDLKIELAVNSDNPDVCWINIDELKNIFKDIVICEINVNNFQKGLIFEFSKNEICSYGGCYFECEDKVEIGATVCQEDFRNAFENNQNYRYKKIRIFIAKIKNQSGVKIINSNHDNKRNISINQLLDKGKYIIYFEIDWLDNFSTQNKIIKLNLNYNVNDEITQLKFVKLNPKSFDRANFLSNLYYDLAFLSFKKFNQYEKKTIIINDHLEAKYGQFTDYYFIFIKNITLVNQTFKGNLKINLKGCYYKDLTLSLKDFANYVIDLIVPPHKDIYFLFRILEKGNILDICPEIRVEPTLHFFKNILNVLNKFEMKSENFELIKLKTLNNKENLSEEEFNDLKLKEYILNNTKMIKRKFNNNYVDITVGILAKKEGLFILYINNTVDLNYYEKLYYQTENLILENDYTQISLKFNFDYVEINLNPKDFVILKWRNESNENIYSYNFKNNYKICEFKKI